MPLGKGILGKGVSMKKNSVERICVSNILQYPGET